MLEKSIVNTIIKYLRSLDNCFCFKEHGGIYSTAGIPDLICCYRGIFIAFEVKTDKGRATELQKVTIAKIINAGGIAVVVRSLVEVMEVIDKIGGEVDGDS